MDATLYKLHRIKIKIIKFGDNLQDYLLLNKNADKPHSQLLIQYFEDQHTLIWDKFPKIKKYAEQSMKTNDVDPKETMDTLRQMKQKDRLVKMERANEILLNRKEVRIRIYEELKDMFVIIFGRRAIQTMGTMPKTKSPISIDKKICL